MALSDIWSTIGSGTGGTLKIFVWSILIGGFALLLAGGGFAYWYFKKRWNLRVEIKLPRSDGRLIQGEWGKGFYDAKKGVVFIRRKGKGFKSIAMEVFDVKRYLQGSDLLTVIQVAPEDYRPVLNESWSEYKIEKRDKKTGEVLKDKAGNVLWEKLSIMNIVVDTGLNKAWKSSWDAAAKRAYSLQSFFAQFQTPIAIGIVILSTFVGFAIIWTRLGSICTG
ncbi:hypothetical protein LCGC14_0969560 [marine sediment metagenome]|uniref:Uncharacterized protein n=1 Tax=marine sediment metagenome TaxID=412755 RepID=A0A0F9RIF7_9ZZZZ